MSTPIWIVVFAGADETTVIGNITENKTLMNFLQNLTPTERRKLRKMGTKRTGYVQEVYAIVLGNPASIPSGFDLSDWTKVETLYNQLVAIRSNQTSFTESLDDTILLLGNERITFADNAYGFLKQSAKGNGALTTATESIAKQFAGQGRETKKTTFSIGANAQVVVSDVSVRTQFLNTGGTPLQILAGSAIGKYIPQTVAPGAAFKLDTSYTSLTVINQTAVAGAFTVKLKTSKV